MISTQSKQRDPPWWCLATTFPKQPPFSHWKGQRGCYCNTGRRLPLEVLASAVKTAVSPRLHAHLTPCSAPSWTPAGWKTARRGEEEGGGWGCCTWNRFLQGGKPRLATTSTRAPAAVHSGRTSSPSPAPELPPFPPAPASHAYRFLSCLSDWSSKCSPRTPTRLTTGRGCHCWRGQLLPPMRMLGVPPASLGVRFPAGCTR